MSVKKKLKYKWDTINHKVRRFICTVHAECNINSIHYPLKAEIQLILFNRWVFPVENISAPLGKYFSPNVGEIERRSPIFVNTMSFNYSDLYWEQRDDYYGKDKLIDTDNE